MKIDSIPELAQLPEPERHMVLASASAGVFRDPRVWGAYAAQGLGFVLLFFVFFPTAQPRLLLILEETYRSVAKS